MCCSNSIGAMPPLALWRLIASVVLLIAVSIVAEGSWWTCSTLRAELKLSLQGLVVGRSGTAHRLRHSGWRRQAANSPPTYSPRGRNRRSPRRRRRPGGRPPDRIAVAAEHVPQGRRENMSITVAQ
jgi:hypothetical protein